MLATLIFLACTNAPAPEPAAPPTEPAAAKAKAKGKAPPARPPLPTDAEVVKPAVRDPSRFADARCNDGTPFGYIHRRSPSKTWVIRLEGGFFCDDDKATCAGRKPHLITTLPGDDGAPASLPPLGVFAADPKLNPDFATANHVSAQYCSSDLWTGSDTARQPLADHPDGWYFAGRTNVSALLATLPDRGLADADPDTRILIVGHSAGGAGVVANYDAILDAFPQTVAGGRLKVVLDGSWVPTQPTDARLPNAARWGPVHPACHADRLAKRESPARCIYGPVWWPYVAARPVPILVQIAGLDASQVNVFDVKTAAQQQAWKDTLRPTLAGLPNLFSAARKYHTLSVDRGFAVGKDGMAFRDVLGRFWRDGKPERVELNWDADDSAWGDPPPAPAGDAPAAGAP